MQKYQASLMWIAVFIVAVQMVPSAGYFMPRHLQNKPSPTSEVFQTNDFGARTMYIIVTSDGDSHLNLPQSRRVRRDASLEWWVARKPNITRLAISCQITARFAETKVDSTIENRAGEDLESLFTVQLPETAFIANFTMIIDGIFYTAKVAEKSEAEEEYEEAKKNNKTAGHVSGSTAPRDPIMKERGMEVFNVAINVKAKSSTKLTLTYQQLLVRDLGIYEYVASIRPRQIVDDLKVNIKLYEPQGIKYVDVYEPGQNSVNQAVAEVRRHSTKMMEVTYSPNRKQQKAIIMQQNENQNGMDGDFIIRYDVEHSDKDAGHVTVDGGFFVHYFSPSGLLPQPKNIIFVIDRSGSMSGEKMDQTKQAMMYILENLHPSDAFQMIYFDDKLQLWSGDRLVEATPSNVKDAQNHVREYLKAIGSTNINSALVKACQMLRHQGVKGSSFIVFLTDGHPTSGETNHKKIAKNVAESAAGEVVIFSLGFGFDLNFDLLKDISYRTEGTVRRIYPGMDAAQQIKDFMSGVNTPLIYEIELQYEENAIVVDSLTQRSFPQYFNGSELIVAGKLSANPPTSWTVNVVGVTGENDSLTFQKDISSIEDDMKVLEKEGVIVTGFAERLWAHLTINDLLRQRLISDDSAQQDMLYEEALKLALQYKLVTPLTSLLIKEADQPQMRKQGFDLHASAYPTMYSGCASLCYENIVMLISSLFFCNYITAYRVN